MAKAFNTIRTKLGLDDTLGFGKYQGSTVLDLCKDCPGYVSWLIQNTELKFYPSVHEELSRNTSKHVPRGAWVYPGDLRGEMAHEAMTQIQQAIDEDWDDVPF